MFSRRSFDPPALPQETGNVAQDYQALRNHVGQLQRWVASVLRQLNQPGSITISQGKIDDTNIGADKAGTGDFTSIGATTPGTGAFAGTLFCSGTGTQLVRATVTDDTTSSFSACQTISGASQGYLLNHAASRTTTRYGITLGGYVEVFANDNTGTNNGLIIGTQTAKPVVIGTNNTERGRWDGAGNLVVGTGGLATTATDGFPYIPSCAGTPTGTPTSYSNRVPLVYDRTNNKLYAYNGAWKAVTLA